ncbi:MAG TPA: ABC transporter substrate-binding protein [Pseudonocardiaceae bacterium]|nr:ABC transporter substrate-binding protein [Pseudonocardiaceae bacterium]
MSRRHLLHAGATAGAALFLSACGNGGGSTSGATAVGTPRPGGTLTIGALGRASAITRDPHGVQVNESDYLILSLLYDTLTIPGSSSIVAPRLATRWEPSADLRRWRFELAEGARFHDGTPLTSDDVVWSMRRLRESSIGVSRLPGIDVQGITSDGPRVVIVESNYPNSAIPVLMRLTTFVIKNGTTDPAGSPGTGPFRLEWFSNGNARLVRNDNWYGGRALLDAIEVRLFESPQAMANAALSGEIGLASNVGTVAARVAEGRDGVKIVRRKNDTALMVVMRAADGPYADPRVREAFRLAVDRQTMVRQVLSGYGSVGNDILGTADPAYARDLPQRRQDVARAGALLDEARFDRSVSHQILTTEDVPGLAESATLFAQQMQSVGVKIQVVKQESSTFLGQSRGKAPLYTTYWGTNDSVIFCAGKLLLSDSQFNEAAWHDPAFDNAYRSALSTADPERSIQLMRDLQKIEYDGSGYLLWGMAEGMDIAKNTVQGLPQLPGYGRVQLEHTWLSA